MAQHEHGLIMEVRTTLSYFRDIFAKDPDIVREIDQAYEDMVIFTLRHLIEVFRDYTEVFDLVLKYFRLLKIVCDNITWTDLANDIEKYDRAVKLPVLRISSRRIAKLCLDSINATEVFGLPQSVFDKIIEVLTPLFKCVDLLFEKPIRTLRRVGELNAEDEII